MRILPSVRAASFLAITVGIGVSASELPTRAQEAKPNADASASAKPSAPEPAPAPISTKYRFEGSYSIDIDADELSSDDRKASGSLRIDYANTTRRNNVEVVIESLELTERRGDQNVTTKLSREGVETQTDGRSSQMTKRADLDPIRQRMLEGFGVKLATIFITPEGEELAREPHLRSGPLVTRRILESVRAFHVNFPKNADTWNAPLRLPISQGRMAEGVLRLEKTPNPDPKASSRVKVKVTGALSAQGRGGSLEVASGEYRIAGEQTYDLSRNEWTSGSWRVEMNLTATSSGRPINITGVMELSLKQR